MLKIYIINFDNLGVFGCLFHINRKRNLEKKYFRIQEFISKVFIGIDHRPVRPQNLQNFSSACVVLFFVFVIRKDC